MEKFRWIRQRALALLMVAAALTALSVSISAQIDPVPFGVVRIQVTSQRFDQILPWNKISDHTLRGNAAVVEGRKLITTADLVKNSNYLAVRKFGRYPDYPARIVWIDYDLNLALLEVANEEFWQGLKPLPLADRPVVKGRFNINRWRSNGQFEKGSGEVVDFRVSTSPFGLMEYPVMRGTTAMGGLGWAEILTSEGKIIGIITSHDNQEIEVTSSEMMKLLLQASQQKNSQGFVHRGFAWQRLNQEDLRAYFNLSKSGSGVLVRKLFPGGTGSKELKVWDILHKINGYEVDPEGKIDHPIYGLLTFTMAFNESLDPTLKMEIQRDGKRMRIELKKSRFPASDYRVPPPRFGEPNDYEVFGGLVLQELSLGYLRLWGSNWQEKAPSRLVMEYVMRSLRDRDEDPQKVVFVSRVLPDPSNLGYEDVTNAILLQANGKKLKSLNDFREAVKSPVNGYHLIDVMPGQGRGRMVFEGDNIERINQRVHKRYGIPARKG